MRIQPETSHDQTSQLFISLVFPQNSETFFPLKTLRGPCSAYVSLLRKKKKIPEKIIMDCLHGWLCYNTFSRGTKRGHCSWIWYKLLLRSRGVGINPLIETAWLCLRVSLLIFFFFFFFNFSAEFFFKALNGAVPKLQRPFDPAEPQAEVN